MERVEKMRILVADDSGINRKVVRMVLEKRGHEVVAVTDGEEAVRQYATDEFDLVLLDMQMPVLGGVRATPLLRKIEKFNCRRAVILALTSHEEKSIQDEIRQAGMDGFLSKPIDLQELYLKYNQTRMKNRLRPAQV